MFIELLHRLWFNVAIVKSVLSPPESKEEETFGTFMFIPPPWVLEQPSAEVLSASSTLMRLSLFLQRSISVSPLKPVIIHILSPVFSSLAESQ